MAAGRSYYGGGGGGAGSSFSRYPPDSNFVNPEYYDYEGYGAYGYEPQKTEAIDSGEDHASKRRKLDNMTICVDYIRGYCPRGARCVKAHVAHVDSIDEREILAKTKFCHDFQNRGMCSRPTCRFLHVTRREEDEFLLTGTIPSTVFDRARDKGDMDPNYSSFSSDYDGPPPRRGGGMSRPQFPSRRPPPDSYYQSSRYDPYDYYGGYESDRYGSRHWEDSMRHPHRGRRYSEKEIHSFSQPITFGNYCMDYLKGTCNRGRGCRLVHVEVVEDMDDREALVKNVFCHDFQNKRCPRTYCKYLHATFDEQKVFIERGYLPPSVRARNKNKIFFSDVCIDNLRSQCIRGNSCQYQHVNFVEDKEERIYLSRSIFCHDYQDGSCPRNVCKLLHTDKGDEAYFIQTGSLPDHLRKKIKEGTHFDPSIEAILDTVCRDSVKGVCNRGVSCKFYHPRPDELDSILAYQKNKRQGGRGPINNTHNTPSKPVEPVQKVEDQVEQVHLQQENQDMKQRVQQLERLLADACHCITLAVGDQNPTIKTLMQSIAGMAPESALANNQLGQEDTKHPEMPPQ